MSSPPSIPNIKVEIIKTSWDEHNGKLTTLANAGEAPDIAEVSYSTIGTLRQTWASASKLTSTWTPSAWLITIRTRWTTCP